MKDPYNGASSCQIQYMVRVELVDPLANQNNWFANTYNQKHEMFVRKSFFFFLSSVCV